MNQLFNIKFLIPVVLSVLVAGCGGGSNNNVLPAPESSNWDTLVWDQDNWG